jgi:hypothetical protein
MSRPDKFDMRQGILKTLSPVHVFTPMGLYAGPALKMLRDHRRLAVGTSEPTARGGVGCADPRSAPRHGRLNTRSRWRVAAVDRLKGFAVVPSRSNLLSLVGCRIGHARLRTIRRSLADSAAKLVPSRGFAFRVA